MIYVIYKTFTDCNGLEHSTDGIYAVTSRKKALKEIEGRPDLGFYAIPVVA